MPETRDAVSSAAHNPELLPSPQGTLGQTVLGSRLGPNSRGSGEHKRSAAGPLDKSNGRNEPRVLSTFSQRAEEMRRRANQKEAPPPSLEERFWQFTPDLPECSEDSDDSADERALVRKSSSLFAMWFPWLVICQSECKPK